MWLWVCGFGGLGRSNLFRPIEIYRKDMVIFIAHISVFIKADVRSGREKLDFLIMS